MIEIIALYSICDWSAWDMSVGLLMFELIFFIALSMRLVLRDKSSWIVPNTFCSPHGAGVVLLEMGGLSGLVTMKSERLLLVCITCCGCPGSSESIRCVWMLFGGGTSTLNIRNDLFETSDSSSDCCAWLRLVDGCTCDRFADSNRAACCALWLKLSFGVLCLSFFFVVPAGVL